MRAFGTEEVTEERMAKALEQFLLTLISNQSRYDQWLLGEASLTLSEDRGRALFFDEFDPFNPELSGGRLCALPQWAGLFKPPIWEQWLGRGGGDAGHRFDGGCPAATRTWVNSKCPLCET